MQSDLYDAFFKGPAERGDKPTSEPYSSAFYRALTEIRDSGSAGWDNWLARAFINAQRPSASSAAESFIRMLNAKPHVFVSYHHGADRSYYDHFAGLFADKYDICHDNSVERQIDSSDPEYVMRRIRENYLTGSSCTVVLCGAVTPQRKFVDWEIKATLDKQHGLIGVILPSNGCDLYGRYSVPGRLHDNVESGYARWVHWDNLLRGGADVLKVTLQAARFADKANIRNNRDLKRANR